MIGSVEQLWELLQAQEAARVSVQSLAENARSCKVHKQRCQEVAQAANDAFKQLEAALQQRSIDNITLLTAAARLCETAKRGRTCVDEVGKPGAIGRLTASFQRKSADRTLSEFTQTFQAIGAALASPSLRVVSSHALLTHHLQSVTRSAHHASSLAGGPLGSARTSRRPSARGLLSGGGNISGPLHLGSMPLATNPSGAIESVASLPHELQTALSNGLSSLARLGTGNLAANPSARFTALPTTSGELVLASSSSALLKSGSNAAGRNMPFGAGSVRAADGSRVHRLCFMRGVGGASAAVQIMVVLPNKAEVYSAALDSFHSVTPMDQEIQKVTAAVLYEPTVDLITGHFGGTVLVYGRPGLGPTAAGNGATHGGTMTAAAAAATAAAQAGVPLVLRLSRQPVTALHCVPAVELEAAAATAAAAAAAGDGGGAAGTAATGDGGEGGPRPAAAVSRLASTSYSRYTVDDVLLFTGDAVGRIMAVRYHRVQSEVLFCTVFQPAPAPSRGQDTARERERDSQRREREREAERQGANEIGGDGVSSLLYRSGCLVVATSGGLLRTIKVVAAGQPERRADGAVESGSSDARVLAGAPAAAPGGAPAARQQGPGQLAAAAAAHTGARTQLSPSASVNLLSPAVSALPVSMSITVHRTGGNAAPASAAAAAKGGEAGGAAQGGAGNGADDTGGANGNANGNGGGNANGHAFRRGVLNLNTGLVDTYDFAVFGTCTCLVAVEWGQPAAADATPSGSPLAARTEGGAGDDAATPGPYSRCWSSAGAVAGSTSLGAWVPDAGNAPEPGVPDGGGGGRGAPVAPRTGPWRLLSAHSSGQLLLWNLTAGRLNLVCTIGEPGPSIVSICIFPDLGTMVEVLSSGELRVGPPPSSSLAPPINPLGGIPTWRLRQAKLRAHRSRITAATALAHSVATGSRAGGVKVWSVLDLRSRAEEQGVSFMQRLPDRSGAAAAVAAAAAAAAAAVAAAAASDGGADVVATGAGGSIEASAGPSTRYPFPADVVTFTSLRALPNASGGGAGGGGGGGADSQATASEDRYPLGVGRAQPPSRPASVMSGPVAPPPYPSQGSSVAHYPLQHLHPSQPVMRLNLDRSNAPVVPLPPTSPGGAAAAAPRLLPQHLLSDSRYPVTLNGGVAPPPSPPVLPASSPRASAGGGGAALQLSAHAHTPFGAAPSSALDSPADSVRGAPSAKPHLAAHAVHAPPSEDDSMTTTGVVDPLSASSSVGVALGARGTQQRAMVHQQLQAVLEAQGPLSPKEPQPQQGQQQQQQQAHGQHGHHPQAQGQQASPPKLEPAQRTTSAALDDDRNSRPASTPFTTALEGELAQALAAAGNGTANGAPTPSKPAEEEKAEELPVVLPAGVTGKEAEESAKADPKKRWGNVGAAIMQANREHNRSKRTMTDSQEEEEPPAPPAPAPLAVPHDALQVTPPYGVPAPDLYAPPGVGSPRPAFAQLGSMVRHDPAAAMGYGPAFSAQQNPAFLHLGSMARHPDAAGLQMGYGPSFAAQQGYGDPHFPPGLPHLPAHPMEVMPLMAGGPYGGGPYGGATPYGNEYGLGPGVQTPMFARSGTLAQGRGAAGYLVAPESMAYGPRGPGSISDYGVAAPPVAVAPPQLPQQHVPGPPGRSMTRRVSNLSELDAASRRTSLSGNEAAGPKDAKEDVESLPVPPVLPPPPRAPTAPPPEKPREHHINPLLQHCFIRPEDLRLIDPVGQGAEGTVWRGRWHHIDVAVKEMHPTSASFGKLVSIAKDLSSPESARSSEVLAGVIKEVSALMDLGQHPNIIRFVGVCASPPPRIVTEYYKMGSLYSLLKEARQGNMRTREKLVWGKRLVMLQDIAAGMAYLHSRNYIHGDLRSPNVFVTEDQHLKIGDFGFARILGTAQNPNQGVPARLTNPRWQAPEVYSMTNPTATTAADVYSFGIIMYEMLTYQNPYDDVADDEMVMCRHTLNPHWRPTLPPDERLPVPRNVHLQAYKALMIDCWAEDATARPAFHKVAERLMALIRWQRTLSQVRRSLLGARQFKAVSLRRGAATNADAEAAVAAASTTPEPSAPPSPSRIAAAAVATGADPPALLEDLGLTLAAHEHDLEEEIDRDLLQGTREGTATPVAAATPAEAEVAPPPAAPAAASPPAAQQPATSKAAAMFGAVRGARDLLSHLPSLSSPMGLSAANGPTTVAAVAAAARAMAALAAAEVVAPVGVSSKLMSASPSPSPSGGGAAQGGAGSGGGADCSRSSGNGGVGGAESGSAGDTGPPRTQASISFKGQLPSAKAIGMSAGEKAGGPAGLTATPTAAPDATLEPVPTLASTGSRPLLLAAASTRGAAPAPPKPALGQQDDGFGLLSPFNAGDLSDDDASSPPVRLAAPVRVLKTSPPTPTASMPAAAPGAAAPAASSTTTAAAAPAAAVARVAPAAGAQPAPKADPFALSSPFNAIGSLDSDDEALVAPRQAAVAGAAGRPEAPRASKPDAQVPAPPPARTPVGADPYAMRSPFHGMSDSAAALDDDDD